MAKLKDRNRLKTIQAGINIFADEAILIAKPENRIYASGFTGSFAFLVITQNTGYLLTDFRYIEQAKEQTEGFYVLNCGADLPASLKQILPEEKISALLFEEDYITYAQYQSWQGSLQPLKLKPAEGIIEKLRIIKDENEIKLLKKAAAIADSSFNKIIDIIKPGLKEVEVALELEYQMRSLGASGPSFETIVASGLRSSLPHGVASQKTLQAGDLVLFDFGATYRGYHSDMTRTVVLGKATEEQKKLYKAVLDAQLRSLETVKPGISCHDLDNTAREYLALLGYGSYFGHSLGHGVGLAIHENPRVSPNSGDILQPGMVITIEPGVYINDIGGVRIEDLVAVTAEGYCNLTRTSKGLLEI